MNGWEWIFLQSRVNDGCYDEDELPQQYWDWPKGTWFQARLDKNRDDEPLGTRRYRKKLSHEMQRQAA